MIKQKAIRICDFCGEEIDGDFIKVNEVPNEGCSMLYLTNEKNNYLKSVSLEDGDYCNLQCFFDYINKEYYNS